VTADVDNPELPRLAELISANQTPHYLVSGCTRPKMREALGTVRRVDERLSRYCAYVGFCPRHESTNRKELRGDCHSPLPCPEITRRN
jgi:hypothetical protein